MNNFFQAKKGFTLVEMVLYVAVCSLILLSISVFLSFLLSSRVKSQSITEVNQQGFYVTNLITQTLRNSQSVGTPSSGLTSSSATITTRSPLLNPTIFSVSSSTLYIKEGSALPVALTNSRIQISSLLFENVPMGSSTEKLVRVSFTLSYKNPENKGEYSFSKNFTGSATLR